MCVVDSTLISEGRAVCVEAEQGTAFGCHSLVVRKPERMILILGLTDAIADTSQTPLHQERRFGDSLSLSSRVVRSRRRAARLWTG